MLGNKLEFSQFGHFNYFSVHRSLTPMDPTNLPTPIATGLTTMYYFDSDVLDVLDRNLYYRVLVHRDDEVLVSDEVMIYINSFSEPQHLTVIFDHTNFELILAWDVEGEPTEQRYYCSETPIDIENLPVPKAILAGNVRTHIDSDCVAGKKYYLRMSAVKNNLEKMSDEKSMLFGKEWTPQNLSVAAKVWLDDTTIVSSGGIATNWNNLNTGANINFSQSNTSYRPTIISNAINGKEAIRFDGVDDYLIASTTEAGALFRNVNGAFILCVMKKISTPSVLGWVFSAAVSASNAVRVSTRFDADGSFSCGTRRLDADTGNVIYDTINTNEYLISGVNIDYTGNTHSIYKNATLSSSGSISTLGGNSADSQGYNNRLTIGARTTPVSYTNVEIACLVVCSYAISSTERQKLEGWAAHKYGLTANLPTDHPYKILVPTI